MALIVGCRDSVFQVNGTGSRRVTVSHRDSVSILWQPEPGGTAQVTVPRGASRAMVVPQSQSRWHGHGAAVIECKL
eukprot:3335457-Rhodomonas_salina.2